MDLTFESFIIQITERQPSDKNISGETMMSPSVRKMSGAYGPKASRVQPMKIFQWFQEPQFYVIACIYMASKLCVNVSQSYVTFYVHYTLLLPPAYVAVIPLVMYIAGFVTSFILQFVTVKLGFKKAFVLACIIAMGMFLCLYTQYC